MIPTNSAPTCLPLYSFFNEGMGNKYYFGGNLLWNGPYSNLFDYDLMPTYYYSAPLLDKQYWGLLPFAVNDMSSGSLSITNTDAYSGCTSLNF